MCAEAVPWRCHRKLLSDYLLSIGVEVIHVLSETRSERHTYTPPAKVADGRLTYGEGSPEGGTSVTGGAPQARG